MKLLILTMVHDFSGTGRVDAYDTTSLPENNSLIIEDNLLNYKKYNPNCHVAIHVNEDYKNFDKDIEFLNYQHENYDYVSISPKRFKIKHGHCQLASILTLYEHARSVTDFDYVVINHSGELYVKPNSIDYMKNFEYGIWHDVDSDIKNQWMTQWPPYSIARNLFDDLFDKTKVSNFCASHLEGSFYRKDLFDKIYQWFDDNFEIDQLNTIDCYLEELMIPTLAHHLSETKKSGQPIGAFYIENGHVALDNCTYIDNIRNGVPVLSWSADNMPYWSSRPFKYIDTKNTYSVKRINRIYYDKIRSYIFGLD